MQNTKQFMAQLIISIPTSRQRDERSYISLAQQWLEAAQADGNPNATVYKALKQRFCLEMNGHPAHNHNNKPKKQKDIRISSLLSND